MDHCWRFIVGSQYLAIWCILAFVKLLALGLLAVSQLRVCRIYILRIVVASTSCQVLAARFLLFVAYKSDIGTTQIVILHLNFSRSGSDR